jgi:PEP-CTERM motif
MNPIRSILARSLMAGAASLALLMTGAAAVRAKDVSVQGANGANGADGVNPGDWGGGGGGGAPATASAITADSVNTATAVGGNGGDGGNGADYFLPGGDGGNGGAANATAATSVISGSAGADAVANGGYGGSYGGSPYTLQYFASGGSGGTATAITTGVSGNGNATVSAAATGGSGNDGVSLGASGGNANASSTAMANGSGDASSSANATAGAGGYGVDGGYGGGNATATANAIAAGGGTAIAIAVATQGSRYSSPSDPEAQAVSSAETVNGAMAQALSTAGPGTTLGDTFSSSTATTSFAGVSVQSTSSAGGVPPVYGVPAVPTTTNAIAQGGSAPTLVGPNEGAAISVALPDKAFAATLIGGASAVASAFLEPGDEIFGAAILADSASQYGSSTFDFHYQGDLLLGLIDLQDFNVTVNGVQVLAGDFVEDSVFNLGSNLGPNIDLTIVTYGSGAFVFGGAVPEPSTWAMMLLGFAGLTLAGYRRAKAGHAIFSRA